MRNRPDRIESISRTGALAGVVSRHPRETVGIFAAGAAALTICINALFLQNGPHPAPIFATRHLVAAAPKVADRPVAKPAPVPVQVQVVLPQPRVVETPSRPRSEVITDIQRELKRRGYYEGAVDGVWGTQTDEAARELSQAAGLKIASEPGEDVLRTISAAPVVPRVVSAPPRNDPIAQLLAPSKQVTAVQRALSDFGYGQLKPTGVVGPETRAAIEKFEHSHKMPVTGQMSDRLVRAIAGMTGRPLE